MTESSTLSSNQVSTTQKMFAADRFEKFLKSSNLFRIDLTLVNEIDGKGNVLERLEVREHVRFKFFVIRDLVCH